MASLGGGFAGPSRSGIFCAYLITGTQTGFFLGVDHSSSLHSAETNVRSALLNPSLVREHLATECKAGRVIGSVPLALVSLCHISRFGVIRPTGRESSGPRPG